MRPLQPGVIEVLDWGRLDDGKVGRDIEVARGKQAEMACFPGLLDAIVNAVRWRFATRYHPTRGKNWVTYALKRLRDQRRADCPRRQAAAKRAQAAFERLRDRARREPVAREVDDVLEVIGVTDAPQGMRDDALSIVRPESDCAADASMGIRVLGQRRQNDTFSHLSLNEHRRIIALRARLRAYVERDVGPGGLGDVFDYRTDAQIAFDE